MTRPPHIPADAWNEATPEEREGGWTEVELKTRPGTAAPVVEVSCGCRAEVTTSKDHPVRILLCVDHANCQTETSRTLALSLVERVGRAYTHWYATRPR